jgi:aminoglycoside phosphotransferase (APT) family kinase protein
MSGADPVAVADEALAERLEAAVAAHFGAEIAVRALAPLLGGACQDNFRVDLELGAGAHDGGEELAGRRRFVLRSDALRSLPGSVSRRVEARVIAAARVHDVPTPPARMCTEGLVRPGASAYLLDWREGVAIGRKVVAAPALQAARAHLPEALADALARIHRVRPEHAPTLFEGAGSFERAGVHGGVGEPEAYGQARVAAGAPFEIDAAGAALDALDAQLRAMVEPHPALHLVARRLRANAPPNDEVVLVHGDFRVGNFLVAAEGLTAVLDWEFAHFGSAAEDLAWIAVRDWRFGNLQQPVGGLCGRERFYAAYERCAGRRVDREAVHWWEVMGNARWAAGAVHQAERVLSGAEQDLEYVAIGRRAAEMSFEALRLLERGPAREGASDAG